jgi:hypothetical protein
LQPYLTSRKKVTGKFKQSTTLHQKIVPGRSTMSQEQKHKLYHRLKNRYRLVLMNDETLEEKAAWNLRPLNVFVTTGLIIILLITITTFIIAFTGLREYIPGYSDVNTKRRVYNLMLKTDSMDLALKARDQYLLNIRNVIEGNVSGTDTNHVQAKTTAAVDTIHKLYKSAEDAELRKEIESQDRYALSVGYTESGTNNSFVFFPPVKGTITSRLIRSRNITELTSWRDQTKQ